MRDKGHEAQGWEGVFRRKKSSFSHNPIGKDSGVKGPLCTCGIKDKLVSTIFAPKYQNKTAQRERKKPISLLGTIS